MKHKILKLILIANIVCLCSSCFDYDGVEKEWHIVGNFRLSKIENYGFCIYFYLGDGLSTSIECDCSIVYYDSSNNIIFAKDDEKFIKIQIHNADTNNVTNAFTKKEISSEEFNDSITGNMKKWDIKDLDL